MFLNSLSGCELVALATYFSIVLSQNLTTEETDILGNFFSALGSNLSTIAATQGAIDNYPPV